MGQPSEEDRNRLPSQTQPASAPEPQPEDDNCLLGSDRQPSLFVRESGEEVQLGEVVQEAYTRTGCAFAKEWNGLDNEKREEAIAAVVEEWALQPWEAQINTGETTIEENQEDSQALEEEGKTGFLGRLGLK